MFKIRGYFASNDPHSVPLRPQLAQEKKKIRAFCLKSFQKIHKNTVKHMENVFKYDFEVI